MRFVNNRESCRLIRQSEYQRENGSILQQLVASEVQTENRTLKHKSISKDHDRTTEEAKTTVDSVDHFNQYLVSQRSSFLKQMLYNYRSFISVLHRLAGL